MASNDKQSVWPRLHNLTWFEWRILILAIALLPLIDAALAVWGFRRVYAGLLRLSPAVYPDQEGKSFDGATQMARMVNIAARRGLRTVTCLRRSLLLWWLLRWHGIASEIRIGVRFEGGEFLAHAWVEQDGQVLNDRDDIGDRFAVFEQDSGLGNVTWV